ncbi:hypothetical protein [Candidatus Blochmannia ocreatus (nom. nud.)]|uniref:Uncharacterized protein n=1 Tax=Candidatus Blochmannia ocreatus (nom. nud.) TaxID=251538 RepID=A0ABY4STF5_9ENTR|nr:hypothetical protein [Candidatus Blochmannia ocreatus]URJ25250.1 hypothetical protein M9405_00750 [Candidatus Blochmannia ocreatus]
MYIIKYKISTSSNFCAYNNIYYYFYHENIPDPIERYSISSRLQEATI